MTSARGSPRSTHSTGAFLCTRGVFDALRDAIAAGETSLGGDAPPRGSGSVGAL